jgi:haloacetate dehalogenase
MGVIKHRTFHANGIRQHSIDAGTGAPVVLLNGFPFTNYTWRLHPPELAERHPVTAPDLSGCGETDTPVSGYDKRNIAIDLRDITRALKIDKIDYDRGARVATRFAKDYPAAIDRLVVVDIDHFYNLRDVDHV